MAVKIRLARRGRKKLAMFDVVVADARAPRDGRFVEKIGTYNPNTNPATVVLNEKQAIQWVLKGAQPTDTVRAILSYKGIMYAKHLQVGVNKGAITQEQADAKFEAWKAEKEVKIQTKSSTLQQSKAKSKAARLEAEAKVSNTRADNIAAKNKVAEEALVASVVEAINEAEEEATGVEIDDVVAEAPAAVEEVAVEEAPVAEVAVEEAPVAEVAVEEAPVAEVAVEEAPVAEVAVEEVAVEEAPVAEVAVEEAPAAEEAAEEAPAAE
jgi:small subunit ribosomal protein S16